MKNNRREVPLIDPSAICLPGGTWGNIGSFTLMGENNCSELLLYVQLCTTYKTTVETRAWQRLVESNNLLKLWPSAQLK